MIQICYTYNILRTFSLIVWSIFVSIFSIFSCIDIFDFFVEKIGYISDIYQWYISMIYIMPTLTCHCCNLLIDLFHRCTGISILHVYSRLTVVPQTPPWKHFLLAILLSYQQHQSIEYMLLRLMEPVASTNFK